MKLEKLTFRVVLLVVFAVLMPVNVESREEAVKDGFLYVHHPSAVPLLATYVIDANAGDGIAFFGTRVANDSSDFGTLSVTSMRVSIDGTVIQFLLDPDTGSLQAVMDDDGEYFFWLNDLLDDDDDHSTTKDKDSSTHPPTYKPSFSPPTTIPSPSPTARPSRHALTAMPSVLPSLHPTTHPTTAPGLTEEAPKKNVYKMAKMKSKEKKSSSTGKAKMSKKNNNRDLQRETTSRKVNYRIDTSWCGPPPDKGVFVREKYRITQFAIDTPLSIFYGLFLDPKKQAYIHRNVVGPEKFEKIGKHMFQARTEIDLPYFAPPALDPENFEEALVYASCQLIKIAAGSILGIFTVSSCVLLSFPALIAACVAAVPIILELGSNLWDCNEFAGYDGGRFNMEISRTVHAEAHVDFGKQDRIKYKIEAAYPWNEYGPPYAIEWESELDGILNNGQTPFGQWRWVLEWPLEFEAVNWEECHAGIVAGVGGASGDDNEIRVSGCQVVWGITNTPIDLPDGGTDDFFKKNLASSSIDGFSTYFDVYVKIESPRDIKVKGVLTFIDTPPFSSCIVTWNYVGSR